MRHEYLTTSIAAQHGMVINYSGNHKLVTGAKIMLFDGMCKVSQLIYR